MPYFKCVHSHTASIFLIMIQSFIHQTTYCHTYCHSFVFINPLSPFYPYTLMLVPTHYLCGIFYPCISVLSFFFKNTELHQCIIFLSFMFSPFFHPVFSHHHYPLFSQHFMSIPFTDSIYNLYLISNH